MTLFLSLLAGLLVGVLMATFLAVARKRTGYTMVQRTWWGLRSLALFVVIIEMVMIGLCRIAQDFDSNVWVGPIFGFGFLVAMIGAFPIADRRVPSRQQAQPTESYDDLAGAPWVLRNGTFVAIAFLVGHVGLLLLMGWTATLFCEFEVPAVEATD